MNDLMLMLSVLLPLSIMVALLVLAVLSQRIGSVTHRPPLYRWLYVAAGCAAVSTLVRVWSIGLTLAELEERGGNHPAGLLYTLPLALSICVGVVVAWRYWAWLIYAR